MKNIQRQTGTVLVISMLMLLVMTMLGVTTMRTANLEEKMSANAMNSNITLQASESAVDAALMDDNNIVQALNTGVMITVPLDLGMTSVTARAQIIFTGATIAPGFSFGSNQGSFSTYQFDATGVGEVPAFKAITTTTQGVYRVGPGG